GNGRVAQSFAILPGVRDGDSSGGGIMEPDAEVLGREEVAQPVAYQIDDGLEVELSHQALLDAVDDGQLSGALLRFAEKALGLGKQPRIVQRNAHAVGKRSQQ